MDGFNFVTGSSALWCRGAQVIVKYLEENLQQTHHSHNIFIVTQNKHFKMIAKKDSFLSLDSQRTEELIK